ncbi:sensor histidine kinase [Cellulosilyticum sp. I15G10I2]|uniref:sensor histidine kinase n=1 Tax=Cellulosilyticum sp. I15G10I2 TaxID=1892843 RepID=UPI00085C6972|nr:sensor histidine kinase [Cellulosilyticum sp. I15G10I2]
MDKVKLVNSFRFKIVIIILVCILIPITFLYTSYYYKVKEIITKKYSDSAVQSVYEGAENIDFILKDLREFSNIVFINNEINEALNNSSNVSQVEFLNIIRGLFTSRQDIEAISLLVDDKLYSVGAIKLDKDPEVFDMLETTKGECVWVNTSIERTQILSSQFTKYFFSLGRTIVDLNTLESLGVLKIDINESILEKSYKSLMAEEGSEVFICSNLGDVISHPNKEMIGLNIKHKLYMQSILTSNEKQGYISYQEDGVEKVAIYSTCDVSDWKLVKAIPTAYLYKEIMQIQGYIIILGILYFITTITLGLFLAAMITSPIERLMKLMKKVEKGNLDIHAEITSKDEIGQLSKSFNNMIDNMNLMMNKNIEEERQKKEMEIEVLRAQINPHFLYNTLNTIKWMAKIQGSTSISNAVNALTKLLRVSISIGKEKILLNDEISYVQNYLVIQRLRFSEKFNIEYMIEESCFKCLVPKLILQPIVENSLIYGTDEDSLETLSIIIRAYEEENVLHISVEDNGPGICKDVLDNILTHRQGIDKFSTVGLNNINQRIKLHYGDEYGIEIQSKVDEGTRVLIRLPIHKE